MKIKKLWISKYKNISNLTLDFNDNFITLLVGQNGLGKSNLLEALALIFRDLDLLENENDFVNWPFENESHFEYDITYHCRSLEIRIQCVNERFQLFSKPMDSKGSLKEIGFREFKKNKELLLPDYVIGYYSGENKRIKDIINIHERLYYKRMSSWSRKRTKEKEESFRKVFFTQNFHSQIFVLTLALYDNDLKIGSKILELFSEYLDIEQVLNFGIRFNNPDWPYEKINGINKGAEFLIENINQQIEVENPFWNIKGQVSKLLSRIYNHQIEHSSEPIIYPNEGDDARKFVKEFIEFKHIYFEYFKEELPKYFATPLSFFESLETANIIDVLSDITLTVKKRNVDRAVAFTELSEGEQQLLTVLALNIIFLNYECLFLLDEPDTHLNPKWQRDYVKLLKKFNLNQQHSHLFVATHSPLIVQAAEEADILLYKKDQDGKACIINNDDLKIHNWRIDQVLASEYFDFNSTRPPRLDGYMNLRERILSNGKLSAENEQHLKSLENEFGVLPTGETIDEIKSLLVIKNLARKIQ